VLRQVRFDCAAEHDPTDSQPTVVVWAADQHLPAHCLNVHDEAELDSRPCVAQARPASVDKTATSLVLVGQEWWDGLDAGENLRCGLIWPGTRPLCEYLRLALGDGRLKPVRCCREPAAPTADPRRIVEEDPNFQPPNPPVFATFSSLYISSSAGGEQLSVATPQARERMGSSTLQTLQDPILPLPWLCFDGAAFQTLPWRVGDG
jgi:hypothetical protein